MVDPHLRGAISITSEVDNMLYTVKEISQIANVTIKTLHHYHKIGLLIPKQRSEAGYRLYGHKELERLQQILFYRELDFPLDQIKQILIGEFDRLFILEKQKKLLVSRLQRLHRLVQTIEESIDTTKRGEKMDQDKMFQGFRSEEEWEQALDEQNQYLKENYDYNLLQDNKIEVQTINKMAEESDRFMKSMASALQEGCKVDEQKVQTLISQHINFLNDHGHSISSTDFVAQTRFFLQDDFDRNMMESLQTGLSYYLCVAAETFASDKK
jgi:DNA-binding transcriptional MerR regulator